MSEAWIIWADGEPIGVKSSLSEAEESARLDLATGRKAVHLSGPHSLYGDGANAYGFPYRLIRPTTPGQPR